MTQGKQRVTKDLAEKSVLEFKPDLEMSISERGAAFLDWAAKKFPGRAITYQQITKVVFALPRVPSENSKEVDTFRKNRMTRIREILFSKYKRAVVAHPGFGIRATKDSEDVARTDMELKAKKVRTAISNLDRSRSLIDVSKITDPKLVERVNSIGDSLRSLNSSALQTRLRLPAPQEDK